MAVLMSKYKLEKKCVWQISNKLCEMEVYYSFSNWKWIFICYVKHVF